MEIATQEGNGTDDLQAILTTLVEKSSELSNTLQYARYLNKDMKELAQRVCSLQKSALYIFNERCQQNLRTVQNYEQKAEQRTSECQWSPQYDETRIKNSPKRKKRASGLSTTLHAQRQLVVQRTDVSAPKTGD